MRDNWECYLCGSGHLIEETPMGYLANYHPLCGSCADKVLNNENNQYRFRLTYHEKIGDFKIVGNVPVENSFLKLN